MTDPVFSSLIYEWSRFLTFLFENTCTHIFAQIFSSVTKNVTFICKLCLQTARNEIIVDLFLIDNPTLVKSVEVRPSIVDHDSVLCLPACLSIYLSIYLSTFCLEANIHVFSFELCGRCERKDDR